MLPWFAGEVGPFILDELKKAATSVVFQSNRGRKPYGYDVALLPLVCAVYSASERCRGASFHAVTHCGCVRFAGAAHVPLDG